jgi:hypothetical protein
MNSNIKEIVELIMAKDKMARICYFNAEKRIRYLAQQIWNEELKKDLDNITK